MCGTCGCSDHDLKPEPTQGHEPAPGHEHAPGQEHAHSPGHEHEHFPGHEHETVTLEQRVLAKNDDLAAHNRKWFAEHGIHAVNLMSSPGSGKTTLLERTVRELGVEVAVIEGDQETTFDADRISATGCRVVQINTGAGCHLEAEMLASAVATLAPPDGATVFIENVGNLVCPALFDLGEGSRVVIMSVTEGADKPLKYPHMFRTADLVVLNKIDLLPYVDFPVPTFLEQVHTVHPHTAVLPVSATRGDGLRDWYTWLRDRT